MKKLIALAILFAVFLVNQSFATPYLTFTTSANAVIAEDRISDNLGLPNNSGTYRWAVVQKAVNENLWFFPAPPANGWGNTGFQRFTYAQMMADLTNYVLQEFNPSWVPITEVK